VKPRFERDPECGRCGLSRAVCGVATGIPTRSYVDARNIPTHQDAWVPFGDDPCLGSAVSALRLKQLHIKLRIRSVEEPEKELLSKPSWRDWYIAVAELASPFTGTRGKSRTSAIGAAKIAEGLGFEFQEPCE
jgi:hypothetical protein